MMTFLLLSVRRVVFQNEVGLIMILSCNISTGEASIFLVIN